ncbi:MAG: dihydropteroate synthase [Ardenticatenaceae bacterium]|nr:dihydropteroate synthase [Ardenticatenaceae bacterium]
MKMANQIETILEGRDGRRVVIGFGHRFVMIGERINPTNRKVLTKQLEAGDMTLVRRDARAQVEAGAQVLDVNVGFAGADEPAVMPLAVRAIMEEVDVPLCIDSPSAKAVEAGLVAFKEMGGKKALINSTTGELERMERYLPLAANYGAAIIGLAHDERGINYDIDVRVESAAKIIEHARKEYGIGKEDILIDPLTLTAGANTLAAWTALEVQHRVWTELGVNTTTGASNVAFGLPDRTTINVAYLPLMISRGLTSAITNPLEKHIHKIILAADVLMGRDPNALGWIKAFRAEQKAEAAAAPATPAPKLQNA